MHFRIVRGTHWERGRAQTGGGASVCPAAPPVGGVLPTNGWRVCGGQWVAGCDAHPKGNDAARARTGHARGKARTPPRCTAGYPPPVAPLSMAACRGRRAARLREVCRRQAQPSSPPPVPPPPSPVLPPRRPPGHCLARGGGRGAAPVGGWEAGASLRVLSCRVGHLLRGVVTNEVGGRGDARAVLTGRTPTRGGWPAWWPAVGAGGANGWVSKYSVRMSLRAASGRERRWGSGRGGGGGGCWAPCHTSGGDGSAFARHGRRA